MQALIELMNNHRLSAQAGTVQLTISYGHLTHYDPATHTGKFELDVLETSGVDQDQPLETPVIQIGSIYSGVGEGAQFPPPIGAQALIFWITPSVPIAAIFLNNDVDTPIFPDGKTAGFKDHYGNQIASSDKGALISSPVTVSLVAPNVGTGDTFTNLPPASATVRQSDLQASLDAERISRQVDIDNLVAVLKASRADHFGDVIPPIATITPPAQGSPTTRTK